LVRSKLRPAIDKQPEGCLRGPLRNLMAEDNEFNMRHLELLLVRGHRVGPKQNCLLLETASSSNLQPLTARTRVFRP
jgi:hypothetical protein